jgi:hypothetical protein
LKNSADEIRKNAAELGLTFEELDSMVITTTQIYNVVKKIEEFLETLGHLSRRMGRTGMKTRSETLANVEFTQFQNHANAAIVACDKFADAQKGVEFMLLTLGRKYGPEEEMITQWEKEMVEDGVRGLMIDGG